MEILRISNKNKKVEVKSNVIKYTLTYQSGERFKRDTGISRDRYSMDLHDSTKYHNKKSICNKITKQYNRDKNLYDKLSDYI